MTQSELAMHPEMQQIDPVLIARQPTFTRALQLCQTLSGLDDKVFTGAGGVVKDLAQWSRIMGAAGQHNFPQEKLNLFMDRAGNEVPLLWLVQSRGYDLGSLRQTESETENRLRLSEERLATVREQLKYTETLLMGRRK